LTLNAKVGRTAGFQGSFEGAGTGQFEFTITENNKAYGSGAAIGLGRLALEGEMQDDGSVPLFAPVSTGFFVLMGRLEADSSTMRGSWFKVQGLNMMAMGGGTMAGGAFSARRVR
jgi:hypothetical protein